MQCHLGLLFFKLTSSYKIVHSCYCFFFRLAATGRSQQHIVDMIRILKKTFLPVVLPLSWGFTIGPGWMHMQGIVPIHYSKFTIFTGHTDQNPLKIYFQESACWWTDCTFRQQYHSENSWRCPPEIKYEMIQQSLWFHSNLRGKGGPDQVSTCLSSFPWTEFWWQSWLGLRWSLL